MLQVRILLFNLLGTVALMTSCIPGLSVRFGLVLSDCTAALRSRSPGLRFLLYKKMIIFIFFARGGCEEFVRRFQVTFGPKFGTSGCFRNPFLGGSGATLVSYCTITVQLKNTYVFSRFFRSNLIYCKRYK